MDPRPLHYGRKVPHWSGRGQSMMVFGAWMRLALQAQVRSGTRTPSPRSCASPASIVVDLISASWEENVGVVLQSSKTLTHTTSSLHEEQLTQDTKYHSNRTARGLTGMDAPGYGIAALRRGSYDDAAASLRPVSTDLPRQRLQKTPPVNNL